MRGYQEPWRVHTLSFTSLGRGLHRCGYVRGHLSRRTRVRLTVAGVRVATFGMDGERRPGTQPPKSCYIMALMRMTDGGVGSGRCRGVRRWRRGSVNGHCIALLEIAVSIQLGQIENQPVDENDKCVM